MQDVEEIAKNAAAYVKNKGYDPSGIDKWKEIMQAGWNPKIVGFLFIHRNKINSSRFAKSFTSEQLLELYNDERARTGRTTAHKIPKLDSIQLDGLQNTLWRYSVALGLVKNPDT